MNFNRKTAISLASAWLLVACGGGADNTAAPSSTSPAAVPATVQLEGCVLGPGDQPRAGSVQALGDDGRQLALANSNADGVFTMRVPAREQVHLVLEAAAHEPLVVLTGESQVSLGACLRHLG